MAARFEFLTELMTMIFLDMKLCRQVNVSKELAASIFMVLVIEGKSPIGLGTTLLEFNVKYAIIYCSTAR